MDSKKHMMTSLKKMGYYAEDTFLKKLSPELRNEWVANSKLHRWWLYFDASKIIYDVRQSLKLTQSEIADMCGVTKQYISHLENNYYEGISLKTLEKILERLGYGLQIRVVKKAA